MIDMRTQLSKQSAIDLYSDTGDALSSRVNVALHRLAPGQASKVSCRAIEACLELTGQCDSVDACEKLEVIARKIPGVRKVSNRIRVVSR